jgi:hypothetical protein
VNFVGQVTSKRVIDRKLSHGQSVIVAEARGDAPGDSPSR